MTQIENRLPCLKGVRFGMGPADMVQPANSLSIFCWPELLSVFCSLFLNCVEQSFCPKYTAILHCVDWWNITMMNFMWKHPLILTTQCWLFLTDCVINVMPCSQSTQTGNMSTFIKPKLKVTFIFVLLCVHLCVFCMLLHFLVCRGKKIREKCRPVVVVFCWVKGWDEAGGRGGCIKQRETHGLGYILACSFVQHSHCRCNASVCAAVDETCFLKHCQFIKECTTDVHTAADLTDFTDVALWSAKIQGKLRLQTRNILCVWFGFVLFFILLNY